MRIPSAISPFGFAVGAALDEVEAEVRRDRPQDAARKWRRAPPAPRWAASAAPGSARGGETGRKSAAARAQAGAEDRIRSGRQRERLIGERARDAEAKPEPAKIEPQPEVQTQPQDSTP